MRRAPSTSMAFGIQRTSAGPATVMLRRRHAPPSQNNSHHFAYPLVFFSFRPAQHMQKRDEAHTPGSSFFWCSHCAHSHTRTLKLIHMDELLTQIGSTHFTRLQIRYCVCFSDHPLTGARVAWKTFMHSPNGRTKSAQYTVVDGC